jgi:hypothetical protein
MDGKLKSLITGAEEGKHGCFSLTRRVLSWTVSAAIRGQKHAFL